MSAASLMSVSGSQHLLVPSTALAIPASYWRIRAQAIEKNLSALPAQDAQRQVAEDLLTQAKAYARKNNLVPGLSGEGRFRDPHHFKGEKNHLRRAATPSGLAAGVKLQRVVIDAKGQPDLKKAKTIWQEGQPLTGKSLIDNPLTVTSRIFTEGNIRLTEINSIMAKITGETDPFAQLLSGALALVMNFDPDPADEFGWPNCAAVPGEQAQGIMGYILFGKLTDEETKLFAYAQEIDNIIQHEWSHLVCGRINPGIVYKGSDGALLESFADTGALHFDQVFRHNNAPMPNAVAAKDPDFAKWAIGAGYLLDGSYLRHFFGKARADNSIMGPDFSDFDWPIKTHVDLGSDYEQLRNADEGGVHLDAAAINNVMFQQTMAMQGMLLYPLRIFALALALARLTQDGTIGTIQFAKYEWLAAKILAKEKLVPANAAEAVVTAWSTKKHNALLTADDLQDPNLKALVERLEALGMI